MSPAYCGYDYELLSQRADFTAWVGKLTLRCEWIRADWRKYSVFAFRLFTQKDGLNGHKWNCTCLLFKRIILSIGA